MFNNYNTKEIKSYMDKGFTRDDTNEINTTIDNKTKDKIDRLRATLATVDKGKIFRPGSK